MLGALNVAFNGNRHRLYLQLLCNANRYHPSVWQKEPTNKQTKPNWKHRLRWLWNRLALSWKYTDLFSLLTFVRVFLVPARYKNKLSCQVLNRDGIYQHTRSVPENRNDYESAWGLHISYIRFLTRWKCVEGHCFCVCACTVLNKERPLLESGERAQLPPNHETQLG